MAIIFAIVNFLVPYLTHQRCETLKEECIDYTRQFSSCQNNSDCVIVDCPGTCGICANTSVNLSLVEDYQIRAKNCPPTACLMIEWWCSCVNGTCKP